MDEGTLHKKHIQHINVIDSIDTGVYRSSAPRGRIVAVDPSLVRLSGYGARDEFIAVDTERLFQTDRLDNGSDL